MARYYDTWTDRYQESGGDVIQACRTTDTQDLLSYIMESAGLVPGLRILDAGCGVCGPATFFAKAADLRIDALTISPVQAEKGRALCAASGVSDRVSLRVGDYHELSSLYPAEAFDGAVFLESLGHAARPDRVISEVHRVLRPGGFLYVKDFFLRETAEPGLARRMKTVVSRIREAYAYNTLDLHELLSSTRRRGFRIDFVRAPRFEDDITVRAAFEARNGIRLFEGMTEFTPCEWLEIRCRKLRDVAALA